MEETMNIIRKCPVVSGAGVIIAAGILLIIKCTRFGHRIGMYEKTGIDIDERLRASKVAFNEATAHVKSLFELIKNRKP